MKPKQVSAQKKGEEKTVFLSFAGNSLFRNFFLISKQNIRYWLFVNRQKLLKFPTDLVKTTLLGRKMKVIAATLLWTKHIGKESHFSGVCNMSILYHQFLIYRAILFRIVDILEAKIKFEQFNVSSQKLNYFHLLSYAYGPYSANHVGNVILYLRFEFRIFFFDEILCVRPECN